MNTEKIMEDIQNVQDNIREIKSTWGNTIMTLDNIKSGLKADVQKKVDEAYKRGYNDAKQNAGEEYQRGYCEGYKKCLSENDFDQPCVSCDNYQRGLDDAWEAARKIIVDTAHGGIALCTLGEIFGAQSYTYIMCENTAQEAIDKIKAYEDKRSDRIEVGDEVATKTGKKYTVVSFGYDGTACGFDKEGVWTGWNPKEITKTGKHYDIQSILGAMKS